MNLTYVDILAYVHEALASSEYPFNITAIAEDIRELVSSREELDELGELFWDIVEANAIDWKELVG